MMRDLRFSAAVLAVLVSVVAAGSVGAQQKKLAMGCTATASSHYAYCIGQAKAINSTAKDLDVSVIATGATVDNIKRMQKGTLDYGLVTNDQMYLAWKGEASWKDSPVPDLRNLWFYTVSAVYVSVREDTGVTSMTGLTGKEFNPGIRGSATEKMVEVALEHLGIKPKWVRGGTSDSVDAMKDKRIVGYAKAGNGFQLDASTMDISTQTAIRVLPFSDEQMKKVKASYPYFPWVKVPANSIKGMGEFWTVAVVVGFGAPRTLASDTAYRLVKAVMEDKEHQRAAFKGMVDDMVQTTMEQSLSPLHAGAVKYYRERGVKIPDNLIPPEAK